VTMLVERIVGAGRLRNYDPERRAETRRPAAP
jgi:hypothetical protein